MAEGILKVHHPCVQLEIPSLISLVHYFHSGIFEVKGIRINQVQNRTLSQGCLQNLG